MVNKYILNEVDKLKIDIRDNYSNLNESKTKVDELIDNLNRFNPSLTFKYNLKILLDFNCQIFSKKDLQNDEIKEINNEIKKLNKIKNELIDNQIFENYEENNINLL